MRGEKRLPRAGAREPGRGNPAVNKGPGSPAANKGAGPAAY